MSTAKVAAKEPSFSIDLASLAPDLYSDDMEADKKDCFSSVSQISASLNESGGWVAKTSVAVSAVSSVLLTVVSAGGHLIKNPTQAKEVVKTVEDYVGGGIGLVAAVGAGAIVLQGIQYRAQRKRAAVIESEAQLVAEKLEPVAGIAVHDANARYRVNRLAGKTTAQANPLKGTTMFLLPHIIKLVGIIGCSGLTIVAVGKAANFIAGENH